MKKVTDSIGRRNFMGKITKGIGVSAVIGLGSVQTALAHPEESTDGPYFTVLPYLQNPTAESIDIMFVTRDLSFSWIELIDEEGDRRKFYAVDDGLIQANHQNFSIRISGLSSGKTYRYRVVSKIIEQFRPYKVDFGDTVESSIYFFTTLNPGSATVSALLLNDLHQNEGILDDLIVLNGDFEFDLCFLNGDVFDHPESEKQVLEKLLQPITGLFASEVPFLLARGNHEARGAYARSLKQHFSFPNDKYFYELNDGPVQWIVLDTGEDKPDDHPVYAGLTGFDAYREEQAHWLEQIFKKEKSEGILYRVIVMHIPPFSSDDWHGTLHCRRLFSPIFEKHGVDLVLSGHTHEYGFYTPCEDHSYTLIIGGGPKKGNRTITQIYADEKFLHAKLILDDGKVIGKTAIASQSK